MNTFWIVIFTLGGFLLLISGLIIKTDSMVTVGSMLFIAAGLLVTMNSIEENKKLNRKIMADQKKIMEAMGIQDED